MLIRRTASNAIAITQPKHAWLAGKLARTWGAPGFVVPEPRDAILCAAGLHDIGWLKAFVAASAFAISLRSKAPMTAEHVDDPEKRKKAEKEISWHHYQQV